MTLRKWRKMSLGVAFSDFVVSFKMEVSTEPAATETTPEPEPAPKTLVKRGA